MDELGEKLAEILNDPESMNRVKQMAENLLGENSSQGDTLPQLSGNTADADDIKKIMFIMSKLKNAGNDSRTKLLLALKPNLSEPRQEKIDTAVKILKIIEILPYLKESGILNF